MWDMTGLGATALRAHRASEWITRVIDPGGRFLMMAPERFFAGLDLFTFLAMPFFILAGEIMNRSGITDRLIALADAPVGYLRGGMAHSNMVASVMFADIAKNTR